MNAREYLWVQAFLHEWHRCGPLAAPVETADKAVVLFDERFNKVNLINAPEHEELAEKTQ
jgi:hypothetical protein